MKVAEQGLLDKLGESYLKIALTEDVDAFSLNSMDKLVWIITRRNRHAAGS